MEERLKTPLIKSRSKLKILNLYRSMSLTRPIHWYNARADLIWPVSPFKGAQVLDFQSLGFHDFQPQSLLWVVDLGTQITFIFVLNFFGRKEPFNLLSVS